MTSDQKPFYAGTYFPKSGFKQLLRAIIERWAGNKSKLMNTGNDIASALGSAVEQAEGDVSSPPIDKAVASFRRSFDKEFGGFGQAPKFPTPHNLMLLLKTAPDMAEKTLLQMYKGGIFDHIGYGFSRYSTDRYWLVPHFEMMLYDQALLTLAYTEAYQLTGNQAYAGTTRQVLEYVLRELTSPEGGFYSAMDADSEGEEGKFYLWTLKEVLDLLPPADAELAVHVFGLKEDGNFSERGLKSGKNVLYIAESLEELAPYEGLTLQELYGRLNGIR
jgi:uncharacterized protein YyaL (SSP411 family)